MDRGNIPGYYYDEGKKKYFRIQADHVVPSGSKYARSNVRQEHRSAKRRRQEERVEKRLRGQTVRRSRIFSSPGITGATLSRELGRRNVSKYHVDANAAFTSHSNIKTTDVVLEHDRSYAGLYEDVGVHEAIPIPQTNQAIVTYRCTYGDVITMADRYPDRHNRPIYFQRSTRNKFDTHSTQDELGRASVWPSSNPETLIIAGHSKSLRSSAVLSWSLAPRLSGNQNIAEEIYYAPQEAYIWDTAISGNGRVAVAETDGLVHLARAGSSIFKTLRVKGEAHAVGWLDNATIAGGVGEKVVLWDTRTSGSRVRFAHPRRITGIKPANDAGVQLLVTSNREMRLYDVRMLSQQKDRYPLSFNILHEGPRSTFDIDGRGMVAVVSDNKAAIFSLKTGREMRAPRFPAPELSQISWQEDSRGVPYLLACSDDKIMRWAWDTVE